MNEENRGILKRIDNIGNLLVEIFHVIGLFIIGLAIIWASWIEVFAILEHKGPSIKDILLLFIYLELGAMVGIYFKTKKLPVVFLIFIAITALTRIITIDAKNMDDWAIIAFTTSILLLCISVFIINKSENKQK